MESAGKYGTAKKVLDIISPVYDYAFENAPCYLQPRLQAKR
ncbi:hypothetical protein [Neisseria iguanae]